MEPKKNNIKSNKKPPTGQQQNQQQHQNRKANRANKKKKQQQQNGVNKQTQTSPTNTSTTGSAASSPISTNSSPTSLSSSASTSPISSPNNNNSSTVTSPNLISSLPPPTQPSSSSSLLSQPSSPPKPTEEEQELSNIEKENLNKAILDIKKKDHAHKKEKQKKLEERKKLLNESIQKKHEQQKQLKKEEEEKKKQLEKERLESEREINQKLNELARTNPTFAASNTLGRRGGLHSLSSSNLGTLGSNPTTASSGNNKSNHLATISKKSGFGAISDEKLLDVLKKKQQMGTIGPSGSSNFNNNNNNNNGSGENSLRKYSSHNSIGIKSGGLFRTISIPRLSKQQISVLDVFNQNNGGGGSTSGSNSNNISPNTSTTNLSVSLQGPSSLSSIFNNPNNTNNNNNPSNNSTINNNNPTINSSNNNLNGAINNSPFGSLSKRGSINLGGSTSSSSSHMNANGQFTFKNFIPNSTRKNHLINDNKRLSSDFFSPQNTHRRWEEYVKNILPSEQELVKEKKELEKQRELQEQELIKQQKLLLFQQQQQQLQQEPDSLSDEESYQESITSDDEDDDIDNKPIEQQQQQNNKNIISSPTKPILDSPKRQSKHLDSPKRQSQHLDSPRAKLQLQETISISNDEPLSETDIEMLSPFKKIEKQEKNDGDRFIKALLNKTPVATKTAYSINVNGGSGDNSTLSKQSEKPVEIVNIFKYGSIDIDFSEVFGEVEDLQGFIMWNINGFTAEEREFDDYCTLHSKESYLVFNVSENQKDSNMYNIHIWNGKDSPIDKKGTAVMLAIQLSTHLGGKVNHYTEEQGKESQMFINYFINDQDGLFGVKYKQGGMDSDFFLTKPLEQSYNRKSRLYKIDIPPVELESCASISIRRMGLSRKLIQDSSHEISWLLINPQNIYIKLGSKSTLENKILTRDISKQFENHFSKNVKIIQINDEKEFCKLVKQFKTKEDRDKDYKYSEDDETIVNLYKTCLKANGKLGLEQIAEEYPIHYSKLSSLDQVYILDCTTDIIIWCPNGVSKKKIAAAKECAKVFFKEYDRPEWAEITVCRQGNELPLFKRQFKDWPSEKLQLANCIDPFALAEKRSNISSHKLYYDFHYINFTCRDELILPLYENLPTDKVDVYGVTLPDLQFFRLEPEEKCHFYEDDCFMIMVSSRKQASPYAVNQNDITQTVIYWWEGVTADNRGYAMFIHGLYPIIANKFEDKGQAKPTVYLATQRKEPSHFLKAFEETLIIHKGSRFDEPEICHKVYQFINEGPNTYIQQLDQNSVVLNSYNVYFIRSAVEGTITIWKGANTYTPMEELESFAQRLDEEFRLVCYEQGSEPNQFWDMLPGVKNSIPTDLDLSNDSLFKFYLSPESQLKMTRINRKYSSDLKCTECCLLDSPEILYIWIGSNCSASLENIVLIFVNDYCKYYSIPVESIQKVIQYDEPIEFKLRFKAWDRKEEWVDPHETRQCQVALQKTLLYRKQYEEEQQLFKEYLDYAYALSDDDDLEDFETWTLIKKGYLDDHGQLNQNYWNDQFNGFSSSSHNSGEIHDNENNNVCNNNNNNAASPNLHYLSSSPPNHNVGNNHQSNGNGKPPLKDIINSNLPPSSAAVSAQQHSKNNGLPPLPKSSKKKKFFGLFKK